MIFDYQQGRGREGPMNILQNFKGYLQSDGYSAYEIFDHRSAVTLMHCMAHARRMFHEALNNDQARASYAPEQIGKLYTIERICKEQELNVWEMREVRRLKSVPILDSLGQVDERAVCAGNAQKHHRQSPCLQHRKVERLSVYTQDGKLNIDNNPVENSIRPVAIGRKNYLFAGSHEAAQRSAMLYSLLGTCKMHGVEPYQWLKIVLEKIADHPINKITELLPHHFKPTEVL